MKSVVFAALAAAVCWTAPAKAVPVTYELTVTATNLQNIFGGAVPVSTVTGVFTLTLDTAGTTGGTTSGITLNSLNIPLAYPVGFQYLAGTWNGQLGIGGMKSSGLGGSMSGTDNFWLLINNFPSGPTFEALTYGQVNYPNTFFYTYTGTVTMKVVNGNGNTDPGGTDPNDPGTGPGGVSETPIPGALPLFASGLGALALLKLRRRRRAA